MDSALLTHKTVGFISYVRQSSGFSTSNASSPTIKIVLDSMQYVTVNDAIHILLDSYLEISMKDQNREVKNGEKEEIELTIIDEFVTMPEEIKNFGSAKANK